MLNKIISLLLCILILTSVFVACDISNEVEQTTEASTTTGEISKEKETEASTQTSAETTVSTTDTETLPETETETESETESETETDTIGPNITICPPPDPHPKPDIFEDVYYGGYIFSMLADDTIVDREFVDEEDGYLITDSILQRQYYVEEFLGIDFHGVTMAGGYKNAEEYASEIEAATGAGCPYDLALAHNLIAPMLAVKGLVRDLAESEILNLYDTEQPWWSEELLNDTIVGGRVLWISDTASVNNLHNMLCAFVNLEYFERINEGLDRDDLYNLVYDGRWTMENMLLLAQDAYEDIKYEHEVQTNDKDLDSYGIQADSLGGNLEAWLYAAGFRQTKLNYKGTYEWALNDEVVVKFINWWQDALSDDDVDKQDGTRYKMFREGRAMFALSNLGMAEKEIDIAFTVLPLPLCNYAIKNSYSTPLTNGYSSWIIPKAVKTEAFKRSATVLEVLAAEGNRRLAPVYFEVYLKRQTAARDPDIQKMFNIIRSSTVFDMGALYSNVLTIETVSDNISPSLALHKVWAGDGTGDYSDIETVWSKIEGTVTSKLKTIMTELLEY